MAASTEVHEAYGAGPTTTVATNYNFGSTTLANLTPATYPITAGQNSYEKYWKVYFSGTFTKVDNLQIWKVSGVYKTNEVIKTNLTTASYSASSYAEPVTTTSSKATYTFPTTDPGSANLGISGSLTGSFASAGTTDYWVCQTQTQTDTPAGAVNEKTIRVQYDEQ